ncbi:unnamed protein product [Staurois parvus]|uniref:Uncharacterized protein n=1 Tax=Staurois parvus TaxID=386267 RepID=A0ABN9EFU6_9NEOB|nr:unnamed protein product [Staurois parvus]
MCHFQVSSHCWCVEFFDIGCWQITGLHSCCQAPNLPWAPIYRLLMLLPGPESVCHGSLYGLPLLLSPLPHSAMCHFQVSSHSCWFPFCHRLLYGLPLLLPPPPHCGSKHWFWPRDWPNE